jgi:RHS repeat-associated protein
MLLPERHGSASPSEYRYGFQGQEKDDELKGEGNSLNYTFRMHDPRIGRFFARDPLEPKYPELTPYQFGSNRVIDRIELEGLESASDFQMMDRWNEEHVKTGRITAKQLASIKKGETIGVSIVTGGIVAAALAPEAISAYEAYTTWYGTTATAGYFAAGVGGTASAAMIDASSYFGASLWQASVGKGVVSGLSNAIGQYAYNGGMKDFNYAQPIFAGFIGNPFLSNLGESTIGWTKEGGWETHYFDSKFFSTFGSNYLGSKIGAKYEVPDESLMYKAAKNVLNLSSGSAVETFENKIGDSLDDIQKDFKDFKIDKSFNRNNTTAKKR